MNAPNSLAVQYRLSRAEAFRFNLSHGQFFWRMGAIVVVIIASSFQQIDQVWRGEATAHDKWVLWTSLLIVSGIVGVVCSLVAVYYWRDALQAERMMAEGAGSHLEISPDCLHYSDAQADSRVRWSAISRVRGTRKFLCLYVDTIPAYVIPRRAFVTPQEAEAFLQAAQTWQKAAAA